MEIITNRYRRETGKSAYKYNWFGKRIHNQDYVDWLEKQCTIHGVSKWVLVSDRLPTNKDEEWSDDVAVFCDNGKVHKLACMNGTWQRSAEFIESGAKNIVAWICLPKKPFC